MKKYLPGYRIGKGAPVYLTAVLEYLTAEILELSGNASKDLKVKRITPRHVLLAVRGDEELDRLIPGTISGGGVIPRIHRSLVRKSSPGGGFGFGATPFGTAPPAFTGGGSGWGAAPFGSASSFGFGTAATMPGVTAGGGPIPNVPFGATHEEEGEEDEDQGEDD